MTKIRKFSLAYAAGEDRIAWDAEDVDGYGAITRIWLTQRFCREFAGAVIPRLPAPIAADVAPEHQATVQGWEQAAAMSGFGKTPGVRRSPPDPTAGLVAGRHPRHAHARRRPQLWPSSSAWARQRSIDHDVPAVRQMLSVMYDLHVAAGWPTDFWPPWITGSCRGTASANALN